MAQLADIFNGIEMGLGTWAWGDRWIWGYGNGYSEKDLQAAFLTAIQNGIRFFDTAEIYGQGKSEIILGRMIHEVNEPLIIASKFMPFPWRIGPKALAKNLKRSLNRMGIDHLQLYQIHYPIPPIPVESWMSQMTTLMKEGLVEGAGVSNYNTVQTERALNALAKEGFRLASNQVEYNLLNRGIEKNGLLNLCKSQGICVIAYSPLAMGVLSGKYNEKNPLYGFRGSKYDRNLLKRTQPLIKALVKIGMDHEGKTASQVALNWVICKGAVPIPGAKTAEQVDQNAGACGWRLSVDEVNYLDELSDQVTG